MGILREQSPYSLHDLVKLRRRARGRRVNHALSTVRSLSRKFIGESGVGSTTSISDAESLRQDLFKINPSLRVIRVHATFIRLLLPKTPPVAHLPKGYGYKGGVARLALAHTLGSRSALLGSRDLDLVRIGYGSQKLDRSLAARYMPDDFRHGHGVEVVSSLLAYFSSRDLSINEVLLQGQELLVTRQAIADTLAGRIAPTEHAGRHGEIPSATLAKMMRLYCHALSEGVVLVLDGTANAKRLERFDFELNLKRAQSINPRVALLYVHECYTRGLVPVGMDLEATVSGIVAVLR